MDVLERKAILTICLMAAFADGGNDEQEREQIRRIAESLSPEAGQDLSGLYQDVLLRRRSLEEAATSLSSPETRQLAYEMAVCVCEADGSRDAKEAAFLERLRIALSIDAAAADSFAKDVADVADAPLDSGSAAAPGQAGPGQAKPDAAGLDQMVLNYAILSGALEILPQSLASMAILPLQLKMVYRIGKTYGYELDRGHIKDFAAALGVGLTGQYVEQVGRKLLGGLFRAAGGDLFGGLGSAAAGSAFSFAATYALGQAAKQYYAGGRSIDMNQLRELFASLLAQGKDLQSRHAEDILRESKTVDVNRIVGMARQG